MRIHLIPIGAVDKEVIEILKDHIAMAFKRDVSAAACLEVPGYAIDKARGQYKASAILNAVAKKNEHALYERVLGVIDRDLYAPGLNFVFGEAYGKAAVISLSRLREGFRGKPEEDRKLFLRRVVTEAVHELGHTYGLGHCRNSLCVMFFSNTLSDTDRKGPEFCEACKKKL